MRDAIWADPPQRRLTTAQVRAIGAYDMSVEMRMAGYNPARTFAQQAIFFGEVPAVPLEQLENSPQARWKQLTAERDRVVSLYDEAFSDSEPTSIAFIAEDYDQQYRRWFRMVDALGLPEDQSGLSPTADMSTRYYELFENGTSRTQIL